MEDLAGEPLDAGRRRTLADADETMDTTLAATRLEGAVLDERTTNYKLRGAIADYGAL